MSAACCSVSRQGVNSKCPGCASLGFRSYGWTVCDQMTPFCVSSSRRCTGRGHTNIQGGAASWDSSGSENVSRPGLRCCEPSDPGLRVSIRTPRRGRTHSGLAWLRLDLPMFQVWVHKGAASVWHKSSILATCCQDPLRGVCAVKAALGAVH